MRIDFSRFDCSVPDSSDDIRTRKLITNHVVQLRIIKGCHTSALRLIERTAPISLQRIPVEQRFYVDMLRTRFEAVAAIRKTEPVMMQTDRSQERKL